MTVLRNVRAPITDPLSKCDRLCGTCLSPIFDTVFRYFPIFLAVLGTPQCPPTYLLQVSMITVFLSKECIFQLFVSTF